MDFRELEAFVAVAEELHFGRAAVRLHISQPPLSSRIKQLEVELGVQLFVRSTRNVALTAAGARLLQPAQQALSQLRMTRQVAASIRTGEQGLVRVGFAGASSQRSLPLLSRAMREAYPGIELKLQSQTYVYTALEMLVAGSLDLAFARLPSQHAALSARVVEVEEIVCALPEDHRLAEKEFITIAELGGRISSVSPTIRGRSFRPPWPHYVSPRGSGLLSSNGPRTPPQSSPLWPPESG